MFLIFHTSQVVTKQTFGTTRDKAQQKNCQFLHDENHDNRDEIEHKSITFLHEIPYS